MRLKSFVSAATISTILKNGGFNKGGYRLLDCTSTPVPKNAYESFNKTLYGKFGALMSLETTARKEYLKEHVPEAIHMDLAVGTYPRLYQAYTMYPPELFQKYMRRLGINTSDVLILYGRGDLHGMLYSCFTAYLLKAFGHEKVSVLDGGFSQWRKHGGEVTKEVPNLPEGNWKASLENSRIISYDELTKCDKAGNDLFDRIGSVNWLDARPRGQFLGEQPTGLDPQSVPGSCIPGSKSTPVEELFVGGVLKPVDEIRKWLIECGYERGKPTIISCGRGLHASVLAYIVDYIDPSMKPRVYVGSLEELENKNPMKISGGKICAR